MSDPFALLGLTPQASDVEIRQRYLELTREFPPDRAPERFAEIRAAYDALRDPVGRLERTLFDLGSTDSLAALEAEVRARVRRSRVPVAALLSLADAR